MGYGLLLDTLVEAPEAAIDEGGEILVVTHYTRDFSQQDGDQRDPHADLQHVFASGKHPRNYHDFEHVKGRPFAIAAADVHASGSMMWSREALPDYLYGLRTNVKGDGQKHRAIGTPIAFSTGKHGIPAGLFRDPEFAHLSAVIFSNSVTLAKFNRMPFLRDGGRLTSR